MGPAPPHVGPQVSGHLLSIGQPAAECPPQEIEHGGGHRRLLIAEQRGRGLQHPKCEPVRRPECGLPDESTGLGVSALGAQGLEDAVCRVRRWPDAGVAQATQEFVRIVLGGDFRAALLSCQPHHESREIPAPPVGVGRGQRRRDGAPEEGVAKADMVKGLMPGRVEPRHLLQHGVEPLGIRGPLDPTADLHDGLDQQFIQWAQVCQFGVDDHRGQACRCRRRRRIVGRGMFRAGLVRPRYRWRAWSVWGRSPAALKLRERQPGQAIKQTRPGGWPQDAQGKEVVERLGVRALDQQLQRSPSILLRRGRRIAEIAVCLAVVMGNAERIVEGGLDRGTRWDVQGHHRRHDHAALGQVERCAGGGERVILPRLDGRDPEAATLVVDDLDQGVPQPGAVRVTEGVEQAGAPFLLAQEPPDPGGCQAFRVSGCGEEGLPDRREGDGWDVHASLTTSAGGGRVRINDAGRL